MKVTIVTVAYNSAKTIGDTLASVAAQTHTDIEHVVIDGGSTDDTLAIVRAAGRRVARLVSEPDRGIYDAMNKGIALATGEWIGFLNADDVLAEPGTVAAIVAAARKTHADVIYGDLVYVREDDLRSVVRTWRSGPYRRSRLRYGWMPPHPTFYVRRTLVNALHGFDTSYRIAADYDFILRVLNRPGVSAVYIAKVLVRMRMGGASNRSITALRHKSMEDLRSLRRHEVGGLATLVCKNLRKLPQFFGAKHDTHAEAVAEPTSAPPVS